MKDLAKNTCRVALVQAEPVMFDREAGLAQTLAWIDKAAGENPDLIVFPELFIPGYPVGMHFGFSMGKRTEAGRKDWKRYYDASLVAGDAAFAALTEAAQKNDSYISIGFSERDAVGGTLYNSNAIFAPDGTYKIHRKLKPTGTERVVWGDANRDYFPVTETPFGPIGIWPSSRSGGVISSGICPSGGVISSGISPSGGVISSGMAPCCICPFFCPFPPRPSKFPFCPPFPPLPPWPPNPPMSWDVRTVTSCPFTITVPPERTPSPS